MTTESMFTPPTSDLIRQWMGKAGAYQQEEWYYEVNLVTQAAEWGYQQGADTELNECCKWLPNLPPWSADDLRKHRRPKPPSLKDQALLAIDTAVADYRIAADVADVVRRALEQLSDNE
jgi:hypothetical protein